MSDLRSNDPEPLPATLTQDTVDGLPLRDDEVRRLALIAAHTSSLAIITDAACRIEWVNQSFERHTGYALGEVRGRTLSALLEGPATDQTTVAYMSQRISAGLAFKADIVNYTRQGRKYWVSVEVQPIRNARGVTVGFTSVETDITSRKDSELRSSLGYEVTKVLAESLEPEDAVDRILRTVCERLEYQVGALWRLDGSGQHLFCRHLWIHPFLHGSDFEAATSSFTFARGSGLPGSVWALDRPLWLSDLASASNFPRSPAAVSSGLKSGFAFPIRLSGELRGVMEFFSTSSDEPSAGLLETLTGLGSQIEQVLGHREVEQHRIAILSQLDSTLESSAEGIVVTDLNGEFLRVNKRWFDLWAIPEEMRDSANLSALVQWIDAQLEDPEVRKTRRAWLRENPDETQTDILQMKDGRVLEALSAPHRMSGKTVGRVWVYRDITERHASERMREELLATLNATLDATTDSIVLVDGSEQILAYNRRFLELWGFPRVPSEEYRSPEMRNFAMSQLVNAEAFAAEVNWVRQHPDASSFQVLHFLDGRVVERFSNPYTVRGRIAGRVWIHRDITERWRAEQELRESEERYRIVVESAMDAILTADESGTIIFASRSAAKLFGYPTEQLCGMAVRHLLPPELRKAEALHDVVRKTKQRSLQAVEFVAMRADGARFPIEISIHRSRAGGRKFTTGVLRDISLRKTAEEHIFKAMLAAESANRAKSEFLANVSHEIRTPLNAVAGLTEYLSTTQLDAEQNEILSSVRASSESLLYLINDLLDFSKIEAGQVDIERVEFDPVALGEQVVEILGLRAAGKGLAMYLLVDPPNPPRFMGDASRIRQILINLVMNALKFTERGSIKLSVRWSREGTAAVSVRYVVEDTGIGISPEVRSRIFQKFFRIDSPVGRRAGGAGLGLSISQLLCEAMGGTLEVESSENVGSRFILSLPLGLSSVRDMPSSPSIRAVLFASSDLAEDECAALRSAGLIVDAFEDIHSALAQVDSSLSGSFLVLDQRSLPALPPQNLARLFSSPADRRILRILHPSPLDRNVLNIPGRVEDLEFPLTPARIRKAVQNLLTPTSVAMTSNCAGSDHLAAAQPSKCDVLVVEDSSDSQIYARRVLERAGHSVSIAPTGAKAVALAGSARFAVIFMDVRLPDMSGLEATRQIRKAEVASGRARTPIIALTAHALKEYRDEAFAADMDDYIAKPARPAAILDAVRRWGVERSPTVRYQTARPDAEGAVESTVENEVEFVDINADLSDLVPTYLETVNTCLAQIEKDASAGHLKEVARLAHNLKGTGTLYGFRMVSEGGRQIERAAEAGDVETARTLARDLSARLARVRWTGAG